MSEVFEELMAAMGSEEDRDIKRCSPELMPYVSEVMGMPMLNHPLVQQVPFVSVKLAEDMLKYRQEAIRDAIDSENYDTVIGLTNRPYRIETLLKLDDVHNISDKHYWEMVRYVWMDSENIWQCKGLVDDMFERHSESKHLFMDDDERVRFEEFNDYVTIYRGCQRGVNERGYSWTLNSEKATWFARRFRTRDYQPLVISVNVPREDIIAYLHGRGEDEIIIHPSAIDQYDEWPVV